MLLQNGQMPQPVMGAARFVNAQAHPSKVHPGNHRDVIPIETELHHRALAFDSPGTNPRGALRQARFVDRRRSVAPRGGLFFEPGPSALLPMLDDRLVALRRATPGLLAGKAQLPH